MARRCARTPTLDIPILTRRSLKMTYKTEYDAHAHEQPRRTGSLTPFPRPGCTHDVCRLYHINGNRISWLFTWAVLVTNRRSETREDRRFRSLLVGGTTLELGQDDTPENETSACTRGSWLVHVQALMDDVACDGIRIRTPPAQAAA